MTLPIIFLHGFLGSSNDWTKLFNYLDGYSKFCFDLPGHGNNRDSKEFILNPPFSKFHLVGYSMGGRMALSYASQNPERIGKLFLLSTHTGLKSDIERKERLQKDLFWRDLLLKTSLDDFLMNWYDQPVFGGFRPDFDLRKQINKEVVAEMMIKYSLAKQPELHFEKEIHLVGENDTKFRSLHQNAHLILNAAHAIHLENPEMVADIIKSEVK